MTKQRKMLDLSEPIWYALMDTAMKYRPDLLLIPGDLTRDGEPEAHAVGIAAADLLVQLPAELGAAERRADLEAVIVRAHAQRLVPRPGEDTAVMVVLHDHIGHVTLIKGIRSLRIPMNEYVSAGQFRYSLYSSSVMEGNSSISLSICGL